MNGVGRRRGAGFRFWKIVGSREESDGGERGGGVEGVWTRGLTPSSWWSEGGGEGGGAPSKLDNKSEMFSKI